jgi:hypothetical protein
MRKTLSISTKAASALVTASVTTIVAHGEAEMISDAAPVALAALTGGAPAAPDAVMNKW